MEDAEASCLKPAGWVRWLKQGGAAQLGRERIRQQQQWDRFFASRRAAAGGSTYTYRWTEVSAMHSAYMHGSFYRWCML